MALATLAVGPAAHAQQAAMPDMATMTGDFERFCTAAFPDDAALAAVMTRSGATAMTDDEVRSFLHDDPGRGWWLTTVRATYAVTLESPPFHACAVRRMTPTGMSGSHAFSDVVARYASEKGLTRGPLLAAQDEKPHYKLGSFALPLADAPGRRASHVFMLVVTAYTHGYPGRGAMAEDARGGPGVEIRMVHQMPSVTP
jgi:hypothetical protein